jgi:hypothetical protein
MRIKVIGIPIAASAKIKKIWDWYSDVSLESSMAIIRNITKETMLTKLMPLLFFHSILAPTTY